MNEHTARSGISKNLGRGAMKNAGEIKKKEKRRERRRGAPRNKKREKKKKKKVVDQVVGHE